MSGIIVPAPAAATAGRRQEILELCDGVDVLIHDAQHTSAEYNAKRHWGHCTFDYAVHVARESGAKLLALYHHDPAHSDDDVDAIVTQASDSSAHIGGPEVIGAREGLVLDAKAANGSAPTRP